MKKKLSIVAALGMSLVLSTSVYAANIYSDISDSYAKNEIEYLGSTGYIKGYPDGTFKPTNEITREEFATMITQVFHVNPDENAGAQFTDVSDWARPYVGALYKAGITKGTSDTTFGGQEYLTREQMAVFFMRALKMEEGAQELLSAGFISNDFFKDGQEISDYAKGDVALAKAIGLIKGDENNYFLPNDNSERQAVARLSYEVLINDYVAKFIKVQIPEATSIDFKASWPIGYYVNLPEKPGYIKNRIFITKEEALDGKPMAYQIYRGLLTNGTLKSEWTNPNVNLEVKAFIAQVILTSWDIGDSGVTLKTEVENDLNKATEDLVKEIDAFFSENANTVLDEAKLVQIGKDCGVVMK